MYIIFKDIQNMAETINILTWGCTMYMYKVYTSSSLRFQPKITQVHTQKTDKRLFLSRITSGKAFSNLNEQMNEMNKCLMAPRLQK